MFYWIRVNLARLLYLCHGLVGRCFEKCANSRLIAKRLCKDLWQGYLLRSHESLHADLNFAF
jgi:hypothetical protein